MSRTRGYTFGPDPYKSIVFYGMFVDSITLCWAAEAWRSLEQPLIGIDILLSRLKHSKLRTQLDKFDLTRIPVSVWTGIKQELIDMEIGEAEKRECRYLWSDAVARGKVGATDPKWNDWEMVLGDQRGWMYVMLDRGGVYEIERRYLAHIRNFLESQGLCAPHSRSTKLDESGHLNCGGAFFPIALPVDSKMKTSAAHRLPDLEGALIDGPPEKLALIKNPPKKYVMPRGGEERFEIVGRKFRLDPVVPAFEPQKDEDEMEYNPEKVYDRQEEWAMSACDPKWTWWVVENQ